MLHHVTSPDGTVLAVERVTDGPRPLVTFSGGPTGRHNWAAVGQALDGEFEVWLADRRGRGDSGDTAPYSFEREYEDIAAIGSWFGGEAVLAAHSSGALCLLGAAAREVPAASLVVYEPPWPLPGRADPTAALDAMEERLAAGDPAGSFEIGLLRLVELPAPAVEGMKQAPGWAQRVSYAHTWPREVREVERLPADTDVLRGIRLRTVLLIGEQSPEHLRRSTAAVADVLPDATVVELPGQGHTALQTAPALVAEAIRRHAG
ncbi:alpha/beta fold hydrolase [Actinomycetospora rhizophila]|uniref:Alpha/beta fold hydrolase n=1 Tax=Actinomycetospora rhizophila TaxID=1416876 RepID=A0ABV9ZEZ3_9PSEU